MWRIIGLILTGISGYLLFLALKQSPINIPLCILLGALTLFLRALGENGEDWFG